MELGVWAGADGRLFMGILQLHSCEPSGKKTWDLRPQFTLNEIVQFTQLLPKELRASRVRNSTTALHWNIDVENLANKSGRSSIGVIAPNSNFSLWTVLPKKKLIGLDCFEAINGVVRNCIGVRTCRLKPQTAIVFDAEGRPCREVNVTAVAETIFRYVLRYYSHDLSQDQQAVMEVVLPKKMVERRLLRIDGADIVTYARGLPGRKRFVFYTGEDMEGMGGYLVNGFGLLQMFTWVAPWAIEGISKCTHLQVDASFKGAKPYAYYVPQAVIANRGLACGLSIAPTEREELFTSFHRLLRFDETQIPHPPILADLGTAISSFARNNELPLYMCHRHLLEAIGSSSLCVGLFQPLLRSLTEDEFVANLPQFVSDLAVFANHKLIDAKLVQKFEKLLGCTFYKKDDLYTGEISEVDWEAIRKWGLFARLGTATCTNQAEAFHRHVNDDTRANTCMLTKTKTLVEAVRRSRETINTRIVSGVTHKQTHMKKRLEARIATENVKIEAREVCTCSQNSRNAMLYQCDGFCYHTVAAGCVREHHEACLLHDEHLLETEDPIIIQTKEKWEFGDRHAKNATKSRKRDDGSLYCDTLMWKFLHSCSLLLDKSIGETLDIVLAFFSANSLDPAKFPTFTSQQISEIKAQLVAQRTECAQTAPTQA